eukprot:5083545-Ditylum_brightwellii.AAC.1
MEYHLGLESLVAVQHEPTGAWYPAFIIAKGSNSHGTFYGIIWVEILLNEHHVETVIDGDCVEYYFLNHVSAAAA